MITTNKKLINSYNKTLRENRLNFYLKIYEPIFEHVFNSNYETGHFGDFDRNTVKLQQWEWFCFFVERIVDNDTDTVIDILSRRDNSKLTREYFSYIIGKNIVNQVRDIIIDSVIDNVIGDDEDEI